MGSVPFNQIPEDPPHDQHFGSMAQTRTTSAMRIERRTSAEGGLAYATEELIAVAWTRRSAVLHLGGAPGGRSTSWWRLEARPDGGAILKGQRLTLAEHPYASGWTGTGTFKPGSKKGAAARPDTAARLFQTLDAALKWIDDDLPQDLWETSATLVAGISDPRLPRPPGPQRNTVRSGALVFGVCDDAEPAREALLRSERVKRLRELTERNRLQPWHPEASRRDGLELKLYPETIARSFEVMDLAVRQALAGPHNKSDFWTGRPVVDKVDEIYCDHLNNLNRQVWRDEVPLDQRRSGRREGDPSDARSGDRGDEGDF